jgi:predicted acylesterase/phospholipase RssA
MSRILGCSAGALVAARAGRARLPKKKWRRERDMVNYKYKPELKIV